jgi:hypothetical protein
MKCEKFQELLKKIEKGPLSDEDLRDVRLHAGACAGCKSRLSASDWVEILPAIDRPIEPSEDFAARFYAGLNDRRSRRISEPPRSLWSVFAGWGWPKQMLVAGSLAVLLGVGIFVGRYPGRNRPAEYNDLAVAESLPLLEDMDVVSNLDLLENFETIENLPANPTAKP